MCVWVCVRTADGNLHMDYVVKGCKYFYIQRDGIRLCISQYVRINSIYLTRYNITRCMIKVKPPYSQKLSQNAYFIKVLFLVSHTFVTLILGQNFIANFQILHIFWKNCNNFELIYYVRQYKLTLNLTISLFLFIIN